MGFRLLPGELFITCLEPLEYTPDWCSYLDLLDPVVNSLKLNWKLLAVRGSGGTATMKSKAFCLGEPWLQATLALEIKENTPQLSLEVATKHATRFLGRARASVVEEDCVSDNIICEVNVVNGNRWMLSADHNSLTPFDGENYVQLDIGVDFEVVIIDCNQGPSTFEELPHSSKIAEDIASSLLDEDSFDIGLQVGNIRLGAHKFMLSARSPVLKAMLATDMLEGNTGVIELKDMSVPAADAFLSFVYSARIEKSELLKTAQELLPFATKYDMPDLHAVCEKALREMITVDNAARLLLLANLHSALELKKDALEFVERNKTKVTASDGWKDVVATNSQIILESIV